MLEETFREGFQRIEAAGIKNFHDRQFDVLYTDLKKIPEENFIKLVDEYIAIETGYPKSITGWFLRKNRELIKEIRVNREIDVVSENPLDNPPPREAACLYIRLLAETTRIWNGNSQEYADWWAWFNFQWLSTFGDKLVLLCREQLEALEKTKSIRKEQPKVDFKNVDNPEIREIQEVEEV